jgi:hypothetical protein
VVRPWGKTSGQGLWLSPVIDDTPTLGQVSGQLLGDPIRASCIESYKGRIYLADGKTLWATELYRYHLVNRTRGFMQFEHDITLVMAVDDGMYVGTTGGLNFIKGAFGAFELSTINGDAVLPGSGQFVPTELVHPQARNAVRCRQAGGGVHDQRRHHRRVRRRHLLQSDDRRDDVPGRE